MDRFTTHRRHRDMRHWRLRRRAMPVALAGFDVHDVADGDLALFALGRSDTSAGRNH